MRPRIWLTATLLAIMTHSVWTDPVPLDASGKPRASSQVYPLADTDRNSIYALPPKLTEEMVQTLARTRHWRPYQAIGTSYVVTRKAGQSHRRGRRSSSQTFCPDGKVYRRGRCVCPYLTDWNEAEQQCICSYGTYRDRGGNCVPYL